MKKYDIAISVILMVLSGAMFVGSFGLPSVDGAIGAGAWPKVLSVIMFFLAVLLMIQGFQTPADVCAPFDIHSPEAKRVLIGIGIIVVFCVLLYAFGFIIAAAVMIPSIMRLMGEKKPLMLAGVTAGVLVCIYLIFAIALHLPLPQGILL